MRPAAGMRQITPWQGKEAVDWLRRSIEANRNDPMSHLVLAAALARLGRLAEARPEAQAGAGNHPNFLYCLAACRA